jgi:hypothetical protein
MSPVHLSTRHLVLSTLFVCVIPQTDSYAVFTNSKNIRKYMEAVYGMTSL